MVEHKTTFRIFLCFLILYGFSNLSVADQWLLPERQIYFSANKKYYFEVIPRTLESPLKYFQDKVQEIEDAGSPEGITGDYCKGTLYRRGIIWKDSPVWSIQLVNDVSPVSAIVSNSGNYVATFDNWHFVGYGEDVVVLYGPGGKLVRKYALEDIMSDEEIERISHSVSSRYWGGDPYFDETNGTLNLEVVAKTWHGKLGMLFGGVNAHKIVRINLETGSILDFGDEKILIEHPNPNFAVAVLDGDVAALTQLLALGEDPNIPLMKGKTAIIYAAELGHLGVVNTLAEAGADLNAKDLSGNTALIYLVQPLAYGYGPEYSDDFRRFYQSTIELLLDRGADSTAKNKQGMTPLLYAVRGRDGSILQAMLKAGADVNLPHYNSKTPLMFAAEEGNDESAKILMDHGADLNIRDHDGKTALIHAAGNGWTEITRALLAHGAAITVKDKKGLTALRIAKARNNIGVFNILKEAGAIE